MIKTISTVAVTASLCLIGTSVSADDITYPVETLAVSVSIIPIEELPVEDIVDTPVDTPVETKPEPSLQQTSLERAVGEPIEDIFTLEFDSGDWSLGGNIEVLGEHTNVTFDITNTSEGVPSLKYIIDASLPFEDSIDIIVTCNADGNQYILDPFVIAITE